jgi:type I restriction enzyme, S subunit
MSEWQNTSLGRIPDSWQFYRLGELIKEGWADLQTGPFGTMLHASAYKSEGTPVIAVQHIGQNSLIHNALPRVDDETRMRLKKYQVKAGDILFGRKGAVDRRALIKQSEQGWLQGSDCIRLRVDQSRISPEYMSYLLGTPKLKSWLNRTAHGSTMPSLNQEILSILPVVLPPLPQQRAIAGILSALDDKIDLLRQQNQTLEQLATLLFHRWFVAFEFPDANGQPYRTNGGAMQSTKLGEVPEGWRVGTVSDEFTVIMGQSPNGESYNTNKEGVVFFQGRAEFGSRFPSVKLHTTQPGRLAKRFDTLVSVRAPVGDVNLAYEACCIGRGLAAVHSQYKSYAYYKMKALRPSFDMFDGEGTVFGSINRNDFLGISTFLPPVSVVENFETVANSLDQTIYNNHNQIQTLTTLRDTLLPTLMTGQLPVSAHVESLPA